MLSLRLILQSARLIATLSRAQRDARRAPARAPARVLDASASGGVSIVIPERGTPDVLAETLAALTAATGKVAEPVQTIIMVNGSAPAEYDDLRQRFCNFDWHFEQAALGFNDAVRHGLVHARHAWTYLLNSDMRLDPYALSELLPHRSANTFAIASQIFFEDSQRRREETGWTDFVDGALDVEIFDTLPLPGMGVRPGFYAGGGSSLYRTALLREYVDETRDYAPFYFEDVEWGMRAWQDGMAVLFCPRSIAWHRHRATIGKFYDKAEVDRVLRRNQVLFDMRNAWTPRTVRQLMQRVMALDEVTRAELACPKVLRGVRAARARALRLKHAQFRIRDAIDSYGRRIGQPAYAATASPPADSLFQRTAPRPRILWIELTSRCPFDCVFCSRKLLRGAGLHLDFDMFRRLLGELQSPDIIRLNYSGESAHYPRLVEACELAAATGARVELVTALAALPAHKVGGLVRSGITRLTISLHTLDAGQFEDIYRFGSLATMRERIEAAVDLAKDAPRSVQIDFAFVAMQRNLGQLAAVADYASQLGIARLAVHPVIRRDPIEEPFTEELDDGRLRPDFIAAVNAAVESVVARHPQLAVECSTPELDDPAVLSANPDYHPGPVPPGAIIHSCDQDPWETIHILANGDVVVCEQRDQIVLGSLRSNSLADIWHSSAYRNFRADYVAARDAHCARCPYKKVMLPAPIPAKFVAPNTGRSSLLDGWFADDAGGIAWSRPRASLRLQGRGSGRLALRGYLPVARNGANRLEIRVDGGLIASVANRATPLLEFRIERTLVVDGALQIEFATATDYCPAEHGASDDSRRLGFALAEVSFDADPPSDYSTATG